MKELTDGVGIMWSAIVEDGLGVVLLVALVVAVRLTVNKLSK